MPHIYQLTAILVNQPHGKRIYVDAKLLDGIDDIVVVAQPQIFVQYRLTNVVVDLLKRAYRQLLQIVLLAQMCGCAGTMSLCRP